MNNIQYYDQIKSLLLTNGFNGTDIESRVSALIDFSDTNNVNVIDLLDGGFDSDSLTPQIYDIINSVRPKTSFVTRRFRGASVNKFVRRSIIE